jgi:hypothetical protein
MARSTVPARNARSGAAVPPSRESTMIAVVQGRQRPWGEPLHRQWSE